jgi:O-antigen ligase
VIFEVRGVSVWSERKWAAILAAFLVFTLAVGGVFDGQPTLVFILRLLSITLIAASLFRLRTAVLSPSVSFALIILLAGVGVMLLHLVPLPPAVWQSLPGREFVTITLDAAEAVPTWMPLTLSQPLTHLSLLALLPSLAAFTASLTLSPRERSIPVTAILAFVLASILLGLLQRFQGSASPFYFYEHSNLGSATGTFANRNTFAALLYISIPLTLALALRCLRDRIASRYVIMGATALMLTITMLGLAVTGSRAGILLGMLGLFCSSFLPWGQEKNPATQLGSRFIFLILIGALLLIGQFGMLAILRLAETDLVSEYRNEIYAVTLRAAWDYFPVGSGFGTFVPVYAMHETPATMIDPYINHAHNDWLELWLEGGLPAAAIMGAFVIWYVVSGIRAWRRDGVGIHLYERAATLSMGLLLLHSFVEYPLRTPAIAALFCFFAGVVASVPQKARAARHTNVSSTRLARPRATPVFAPRSYRPFS